MEPITKEENVVLRLKLSRFLMSEDNVDEIVLSRFNNSMNELANGRVICHFRLQQPIAVSRELAVFYSYEPKFKHYLFMNGSDLIILRKLKDSLVLHKMYPNVENFTVEDHLNLGKPQVVVHSLDELPIITDCNNTSALLKPEHKQIQTFATLVQKSKLRIENAERVLREKTRILSKLSSTLAFNCDDDVILTTLDRLVYLKDSLATGDVGLPAKGKALSIEDPWFRNHSNKWIIGFPVINVSKRDISAFEVYVSHADVAVTKTLLFTKSEDASAPCTGVYNEESHILFDGKSGHIVALMEEPHLVASSFTLKCVCCFKNSISSESEQCYLGQMVITTSDLSGDKYRLSSQTTSTQDIIALQASSKRSVLSYQLLNITREQFINTIESVFRLKKLNGNVLINSNAYGNTPRRLIVFDEYSDHFTAYTDTHNEFMLLLHKLLDIFRGSVLFKHPSGQPVKALEAIRKEISYVKELLVNELVGTDSSAKPPMNMDDAFREMMLLEIDSANEISLLKKYFLQ